MKESRKNVNIVCRPDHSILLLNFFNDVDSEYFNINAYTFNAVHENSLISKIYPKITIVPNKVRTSLIQTILEHINRFFISKNIDTGRYFYYLCNFINRIKVGKCDLLHVWPMYAYGEWLAEHSKDVLLDCYEANPLFVKKNHG